MADAESLIAQSHLDSHTDEVSHTDQAALPKVMIVGAGPGDPALLTVRARNLLHKADIILHDRLVSSQILELCRREAEFIDVGKAAYRPSPTQADVNHLMIDAARRGAMAGKTVVRLKGGRPR